MGMFDSVIVEKGVKCGNEILKEFQTKDLANCLFNYKIKNNKFYEENTKMREAKRSEQTHIGKELWLPICIIEHLGWRKSKYTGGLNIYTSCCPVNAKTKKPIKEGEEWPSDGVNNTKWVEITYLIAKGNIIKEEIFIRKMR